MDGLPSTNDMFPGSDLVVRPDVDKARRPAQVRKVAPLPETPDFFPGDAKPPKTLSPFRYAGGKTWLVPQFQEWLSSLEGVRTLVDPFTGGGIVPLSMVAANPALRAVMSEKDEDVGAVWSVVISGSDRDADDLCARIMDIVLTRESAIECLSRTPASLVERAFHTILKNRVNRGGILSPGASLLKRGESDKGITSRWYPETLVKRIRAIRQFRDRLEFVQGDAFDLIARFSDDASAALFVDPPYTAGGKNAGSRLYTHWVVDHDRLFRDCAAARGPLLMTYDDAPEVRALAKANGLVVKETPMRNAHHAKMEELVITR